MSSRAAMVESVEQRGESDGRKGVTPRPDEAIADAVHRYGSESGSLDLLHVRYWMYYAAGIFDPSEAADVTVRLWRERREN